jgi:hypothetical protein
MVLDVKTKVYIVVGGTSVMSAALGATASYFVTKRFLETKFDQILEVEIAIAKDYYRKLNKVEEFSSPTEILNTKVKTLGYVVAEIDEPLSGDSAMEENDPETEELLHNIFEKQEDDDPNYNLEYEKTQRTGDKPYVITHDEYYENAADWEQVTLTYYENDDVLLDESDTPVPDSDSLVGDKNLTRFGHGSKDNNVVYIENDDLQLLFEVVRNKGNYARDVLGFIEHAEHRGLRRFRSDDE